MTTTTHPNSFAAIFATEAAKFASLGTEKAEIFAAKNVASRLGLPYAKVREMASKL